MARRQAPLQINEFSGGLNTEFNPLAMPPNVSIDELNMDITSDGSRRRRLGFNVEPNNVVVDTAVPFVDTDPLATSVYNWKNAGGNPQKVLYVVQIGNYLGIHDLDDETSVSNGRIYSETFSLDSYEESFSYAVVDGLLVVATSLKDIAIYEYDSGTVSKSTDTLLIRDLFGVDSPGLTEQSNLTKRPPTLGQSHRYNLRNQTFYSPRYANNDETLVDPIKAFYDSTGNTQLPSNADNLNLYLYSDPNDGDNRLIERFFSKNMVKSSPAVGESPKGHFIIDALERGASREEQEEELRTDYPELIYPLTPGALPQDKTPGGARVVEEFSGRIWYGGFSGQVIGGDPRSPRMSSYILFSMLVKDKTDITQCYQRADPTSNEDSAIADTDGGFIRLDEAYGINNMINLEGSLFVFASNGVWRVSGGEGSTFTATSYSSDKISTDGCISPNSVVVVGSVIFYWNKKGIYSISRNEYGFWEVADVSTDKIKEFYADIPEDDKRRASGFYDTYERKIRWLYNGASTSLTSSKELILDLNYQAFTPFSIAVEGGGLPAVVNLGENQPYQEVSFQDPVTSEGVVVTASSVTVTSLVSERQPGTKESLYLILTQYSPTVNYTFGYYRDENFYDWVDEGYTSYLQAGAFTGGEARYKKQAPYLNVFFKRTEDGFDVNLNPTRPSSCMLSSRWNWTTSNNMKKWSTPREAYRYNHIYFPTGPSDDYDTGETVISTRNKIRGMGHSVSFYFESSPGKDMHIHGWSFDIMANEEE